VAATFCRHLTGLARVNNAVLQGLRSPVGIRSTACLKAAAPVRELGGGAAATPGTGGCAGGIWWVRTATRAAPCHWPKTGLPGGRCGGGCSP